MGDLSHDFFGTSSRSRYIQQANWPKYTTNIITEVGEYLYDQHDISLQTGEAVGATNNKLYWNFANKLCTHSTVIDQIIDASLTGTPPPFR